MSDKPTVSAIIANWNGAAHLRICLPSLRAQSLSPLEIIVVDNGSRDDSAAVAQQFEARWLPLGQNFGLAPALNRGAAIASGEFLLFVNNDMRFDREFIAGLLNPLQKDTEVFAADGKQFNWDGTALGHLAPQLVRVPPKGPSSELVPGLHFFQKPLTSPTPVFMGSAASMMVRRAYFDALRGFDDRLPLGYEDVEICWRAWLRGWKTVYTPDAFCWHRVGGSSHSSEGARMNFRGILKGRLLLALKLLPLRYAFRAWTISKLGLLKDLLLLRFRCAYDRGGILIQMALLFPELRRERKMLFGNGNATPEDQLEALLHLDQPACSSGCATEEPQRRVI